MQKNIFNLDDILPGYVVRLRNGDIRSVYNVGTMGSMILVNSDGDWNYKSCWNYDLTAKALSWNPRYVLPKNDHKEWDIVEVYGFVQSTKSYRTVMAISCENRPLLYIRNEPKKMTVSEIEKLLGYEIEIISEGKENA